MTNLRGLIPEHRLSAPHLDRLENMREPDSRVYACLLAADQTKPLYLRIRAPEGVIAPCRTVVVRIDNVWRTATVVNPWAETSLGSVVCLEVSRQ